MKLIDLAPKAEFKNDKHEKAYLQLQQLLDILESRNLRPDIVEEINEQVAAVNVVIDQDNQFLKTGLKSQNNIVRILEKKAKLAPIRYYQKLWMVLGMSVFGIPFGMLFGMLMKNMGLFAIGLPIGLGIGSLIGRSMDTKAEQEGRQLPIELK